MHAAADLSPGDVHAPGRIVIANVDDGGHFVLTLDADDDFIYVRDSGFDREAYNFTSAVGWRVFDVLAVE